MLIRKWGGFQWNNRNRMQNPTDKSRSYFNSWDAARK